MTDYRSTPEYREWQKKVKERDGDRCRSCQTKYYLEIHHIYRVESHLHLSDHIDNGITLCKNCHVQLKNKENDTVFLIEVVTQPLREQLDRLNQTNRSIERALKSGVSSIEQVDNQQKKQQISRRDNPEERNRRLTTEIHHIEKKIDTLIVIPAEFDEVGQFSEELSWFRDSNNHQHGFINQKGEVVIPAEFDEVGQFSEGLAWFRDSNNHQYGFINQKGEVVIPTEFNEVGQFSEELAQFRDSNNHQYGFIRNPLQV